MPRLTEMGKVAIFSAAVMLGGALPVSPAQADPWAGAAGGAVVGGILGGVVSGSTGAAVGAVVGGVMGAGAGAEQRDQARHHLRQAEAAEQQEWERERRRRVVEMKSQRSDDWGIGDSISGGADTAELAVPAQHPDSALIIEVQRSIKRLGYDPGTVGTLNRQTVAIIKMYQAQYDLLETGQPSQELLAHMRQRGG